MLCPSAQSFDDYVSLRALFLTGGRNTDVQVASVLGPHMVETVTARSLHHGCRPLELHTPTGGDVGVGTT